MTGIITFTLQVALNPPSFVVQVIFAIPPSFAVTTPDVDTVAIEVFEEDQETALFVASEGLIVGFNVVVSPFFKFILLLFSDTSVTGTITVTIQVAVYPPSFVLTVIVASPAAFAVILPEEFTAATVVFEEDQVRELLVASLGFTVALRVYVLPFSISNSVLFSVTPVTGITTESPFFVLS